VKRTGRGEPTGAIIHICMGITQGNYLCNYLYLKTSKTLCFSFYHYLLCFYFYKIREQEGRIGSAWGWVGTGGRGEGAGKRVRG
jgi:hypothetical protein